MRPFKNKFKFEYFSLESTKQTPPTPLFLLSTVVSGRGVNKNISGIEIIGVSPEKLKGAVTTNGIKNF